MSEWNTELAKQSEAAAENELQVLFGNATAEEREGMLKLANFWRRWYNGHKENGNDVHATGHKALGRLLVKTIK